jgi:hypothetical protein
MISENWVFAIDPIGYLCVAGSLFETRTPASQNLWAQKGGADDGLARLSSRGADQRSADAAVLIRRRNESDRRETVGRGFPCVPPTGGL